MNNFRIVSIIAVAALILTSCKDKPHYFDNSLQEYISDNISYSEKIEGIPVISDAIGAYSLEVVDTMICLAHRQRDMMFSLYNLNGDSLVSVGIMGQGPSDFTSNRMNGQYVLSDRFAGLWVNDVNASALKLLNLTKSIEESISCVDSIIPIQPMVKNAFIVGDTIVQEVIGDGNYDLLASVDGKLISRFPLYAYNIDLSDLFVFYDGKMRVSPDGNYMVIAMSAINQLNILDLSSKHKRIAVSVGGVKSPDYVMDRENKIPFHTYYSDIALSDGMIYALYENQPYITDEDHLKNSELHVIDYTGKIITIFPLDRFLYAISYSEKDNSIYGIDDNETIVRYKLTECL